MASKTKNGNGSTAAELLKQAGAKVKEARDALREAHQLRMDALKAQRDVLEASGEIKTLSDLVRGLHEAGFHSVREIADFVQKSYSQVYGALRYNQTGIPKEGARDPRTLSLKELADGLDSQAPQ